MRAALDEVDRVRLREGTGAPLVARTAEHVPIGGRVRKVLERAIDRHQAPAERIGARGGWGGAGAADAAEEFDDGPGAEAIAGLHERALGDGRQVGIGPEEAEAGNQGAVDGAKALLGKDIHGDDEDEGNDGGQGALALLRNP